MFIRDASRRARVFTCLAGVVGGGDVAGGEVCVAGVEGFVDGGVAYVDRSS